MVLTYLPCLTVSLFFQRAFLKNVSAALSRRLWCVFLRGVAFCYLVPVTIILIYVLLPTCIFDININKCGTFCALVMGMHILPWHVDTQA